MESGRPSIERRARHYTDRDLEELRGLYRKAYAFITFYPEGIGGDDSKPSDWRNKLAEIESKLARQNVLEARLVVLEDELTRFRESRKISASSKTSV